MKMFPGNIQEMLAQAGELQSQMLKLRQDAEEKVVEASAGGGMVQVRANCKPELLSMKIEKEVVNPDDIEMLEDLVRAAVNDALRQAREGLQGELAKITGGLKLPIPGFNS